MKEANTKNQRYLLAYEKHILKNGTPQEMEELKKLKKEKKRKYAPRKLTQEQRDLMFQMDVHPGLQETSRQFFIQRCL